MIAAFLIGFMLGGFAGVLCMGLVAVARDGGEGDEV